MSTRPALKGFSVLYNSLNLYWLPSEKWMIVSVFNNHPVNQNNTQAFTFLTITIQEAKDIREIFNWLTLSLIRYKASSSQ